MLQITPQHRLLLAVEPIDFRAGIDSLKSACQQRLHHDPFSGTIFAFSNRARTSIKLLAYDASGFWLCQKRFSQGKLAWWPTSHSKTVTQVSLTRMCMWAQEIGLLDKTALNGTMPFADIPNQKDVPVTNIIGPFGNITYLPTLIEFTDIKPGFKRGTEPLGSSLLEWEE